MIRISIIIPHHRDESALERLLASFKQQKVSVPYEIIVVSNPPSEKADILIQKQKHVIHLQTKSVGVNKARNLGIERAKGDILIFLDSDCEMVTDDFLEGHYRLHLENPDISFFGGIYQYLGNRLLDLTYNYIQGRWLLRGLSGEGTRYLIGGNFSCKRSALQGHNFDESIKYGGSETEFFLRILGAQKVQMRLNQNLLVGHNTHLNWLDFTKKAYKQGSGASYIHQKLNQKIEGSFLHEKLMIFEKNRYQKKMDFWLSLYDMAYNKGYLEKKSLSFFGAIRIFTSRIFNFYRIKASNFFGSLESRLRNLSNQ